MSHIFQLKIQKKNEKQWTKLWFAVFDDSFGVNPPTVVVSSGQHDVTDLRTAEMCNSSSLYSIGLAKKFLWFLSKNKGHIFHIHQELYWAMYSSFCSNTFYLFPVNFINPFSQNFLSFWVKNGSVPFTLFQGTEIFLH